MFKSLFLTLICSFMFAAGVANAAAFNQSAPIGGTFTRNIGGEPPTLHPIAASDLYASRVNDNLVHETLAARHPETSDFAPRLAEKWEIAKDGKSVTFFMRKDAVFHDGKPVTAEDVKFSFDAIYEPAYQAANIQPYFDGVAKVEVVDPHTVKFYFKDTYYQNFSSVAQLTVIPKHVYGDVEKSKKMTKTAVGAGPYVLEKFEKGQRIVLKRFDKWFGFNDPVWKGTYNFQTIVFRFVNEQAISLEMAKKGELDFDELNAEAYVKKTEGAPWGQTVFKNKIQNRAPKGYGFVGWNQRRELFKDKNVRIALAHLMNREEMNQKFRYGMSELAAGPVYNQSEYASKKVKAIEFSPKKAAELLTKSGWKDSNKDGVLEKSLGGKQTDFRFTLLYANKDTEKYWTLYKEDLRKAGIVVDLKYLEWNSFINLVDHGNFDAVAMGWSSGFLWDPKQIWYSKNAVVGGSNFIAYNNPEVDKLIETARLEVDAKKRRASFQKVYELIAADAPYAFLFNDKFGFYANSNKVDKPADTFQFDVFPESWWTKKP